MATSLPASNPLSDPAPKRPKVILWKWSLVATALFIGYLSWECGSGLYQGSHLAKASVHRFHQELNDGQYDQICQEADAGFQQSDKHDELVKFLQAVHTKLGNATAESQDNINVSATTNGTTITTVYSSTFDRGAADETFTWVKNGKTLKLRGYNIQSNVFILH